MLQLANSTQISNWFNPVSRDAQELLPLLVRRLIFSSILPAELTCPPRIPAGDDVRRHGFDGHIEFSGRHPFVPTGLSVWEMGISSDAAGKFRNDYRVRTADPQGIDARFATFVFVTPHAFLNKQVTERRTASEGAWAAVRILDNADLEAWLELAPSVALWLAERMGWAVTGMQDLDTSWKLLEAKYRSRIFPELVVGGRLDAAKAVQGWLAGSDPQLSVECGSAEEALAFVQAAMTTLDIDEQRERLLSAAIVVTEPGLIDKLAATGRPLVVMPLGPETCYRARMRASRTMRIIEWEARLAGPVGPHQGIRLGRIHRPAVVQALSKLGVDELRADRIGTECKGSLSAVLGMLSGNHSLGEKRDSARHQLAALVLAAQWDSANANDCQAVARLSGTSTHAVEELVRSNSSGSGPLIRHGSLVDWVAWDSAVARTCERIRPRAARPVLADCD